MISKNELKYIQSLYHKKTRDQENVFIVEGPKMVDELLKSHFKVKKIYSVKGEWLQTQSNSHVQEIEPFELSKISQFSTPNQVLAIAEKQMQNEIINFDNTLTLMLDGIQDPGNLGTIIRIADWFGINQIIASKDSADCYNNKVVQATMGSIFRTKVYYKDLAGILAQSTGNIYGALLNGKNIKAYPSMKQGIIVIGNESKGIRPDILPFIQHPVTIPSFGKAESLNAAVATGILLSHLID